MVHVRGAVACALLHKQVDDVRMIPFIFHSCFHQACRSCWTQVASSVSTRCRGEAPRRFCSLSRRFHLRRFKCASIPWSSGITLPAHPVRPSRLTGPMTPRLPCPAPSTNGKAVGIAPGAWRAWSESPRRLGRSGSWMLGSRRRRSMRRSETCRIISAVDGRVSRSQVSKKRPATLWNLWNDGWNAPTGLSS